MTLRTLQEKPNVHKALEQASMAYISGHQKATSLKAWAFPMPSHRPEKAL